VERRRAWNAIACLMLPWKNAANRCASAPGGRSPGSLAFKAIADQHERCAASMAELLARAVGGGKAAEHDEDQQVAARLVRRGNVDAAVQPRVQALARLWLLSLGPPD